MFGRLGHKHPIPLSVHKGVQLPDTNTFPVWKAGFDLSLSVISTFLPLKRSVKCHLFIRVTLQR